MTKFPKPIRKLSMSNVSSSRSCLSNRNFIRSLRSFWRAASSSSIWKKHSQHAGPAPQAGPSCAASSPPQPYLLLQVRPAQRHALLQLLEFPFMLCFRLHLDFALVRVEQLHLLLELQSQGLAFRFLGLVEP